MNYFKSQKNYIMHFSGGKQIGVTVMGGGLDAHGFLGLDIVQVRQLRKHGVCQP